MTTRFEFPRPLEIQSAPQLRSDVRDFLSEELGPNWKTCSRGGWTHFDIGFTRKLAGKGWIGMTWPKRFGGGERSPLERYIVIEELLAVNAPVGAHWTADRQVGPLLLLHGSDYQRDLILPKIAAGECYVAIGLSEPGVGSDLASVRARARPVAGGYKVSGTKVWTTGAHLCHYIVALCRTDGTPDDRQSGLSQLLIDLAAPGIEIRPIIDMTGSHSFNEIYFDDVFVPEEMLVGQRGNGWQQVTGEMGSERSGPERFLSSFLLVEMLASEIRNNPSPDRLRALGRLVAHVATIRSLSMSVAELIRQGKDPTVQGALVKDVGALLEQEIPHVAREIFAIEPAPGSDRELESLTGSILLAAPSFSLRGGTREILRGIIARGLGVR